MRSGGPNLANPDTAALGDAPPADARSLPARYAEAFFTPRWLAAFAGAILFAIACYYLGHWQYGRHEAKVARNERLDAHYRATPVPLTQVMTTAPLPLEQQWRHVTMTGRYAAEQLYVRNRPNQGTYGYEILGMLTLNSGESVVVDRGWVANSSAGANVLPPVPAAPTGEVTVTGWVQQSEQSLGRNLPEGQVASVNVREAAEQFGVSPLGGYVVLDAERTSDGQNPARPKALEEPDRSLGPNQAYAYQWWMFMGAGFLVVWLGIRRQLVTEDPSLAKPKKTRIWDEEDY